MAKLYRAALLSMRKKELARLRKELSPEEYKLLKPAIVVLVKKKECYSGDDKVVLEPLFKLYTAIKAAYRMARGLTSIFNAKHCKASIRATQKMLEDFLDYSMSIGTISNLINEKASVANAHNKAQDLSQVTLGAHDEMFAFGSPILAGIDSPSLYCYLLAQERRRDAETWAIHLFDLQKQGFKPERVIYDGLTPVFKK